MKEIKFPPREVINNVLDILEERDVKVPQSHVEISVGVLLHWLTEYENGHEFMANCLGLKATKASHANDYLLREEGALTRKLKPENMFFLTGCVHQGEVVPVDNLEIREKEAVQCDSCTATVICLQEVNGRHLCSNCLNLQEDKDLKDLVSLPCDQCTYYECPWNPENAQYSFVGCL